MSEREQTLWLAVCAETTDLVKRRALWRQWRKVARAEERKDARNMMRDDEHEAKANTLVCLIDALEEMRPYVGTEAW